jgi:hypothetical protein
MVDVEKINNDRLKSWRDKLNAAHATPIIMLAIGHDHVEGQVHLVAIEKLNNEQIKQFLSNAYHSIK